MTFRLLGVAVIAAGGLFAQEKPAQQKLAFEVASIKPAAPFDRQIAAGKMHIGMSVDGARVDIGSMSLADLMALAFSVKPHQIQGPSWFPGDRFDIVAKLPEGATKDQVPQMLQTL